MHNFKLFIRNKIIVYSNLHSVTNSFHNHYHLRRLCKVAAPPKSLIRIEASVRGDLNKLSSRFEFLSVLKRWVLKPVEGFVGGKEACQDQAPSPSPSPSPAPGSSFSNDGSDDYVIELDHFELVKDGSNGQKSALKLPLEIAEVLYPHQLDGLKWLWSLHCQGKGGVLGDDMGLGKTMQICSFLAGLFHSGLIKRALIVAPKTLLPHWTKELSLVGLSDKTREYSGPSKIAREKELHYILKDKGVLITTYGLISHNNYKSLRGKSYSDDDEIKDGVDPTWDYTILDEGHLIKNPQTQAAKNLLKIPSAHRIVISGTPLQNNLKELWAIFNFCCPGLLGDKIGFKAKFELPIRRANYKNASDEMKRISSHVAKELRKCIQPYFLRRLKSEVLNEAELSQKQEIIVWLRLTSIQRRLYIALLGNEIVEDAPLAAITILKQICDHPYLSYDEFKDDHDVSCKISFIMSLLDNLIPEGHSVLIFSQTRKMLNRIQDSLESKGYDFLRIDGTTKASERSKIVNNFQDGTGAPIFLLTSKVGGLGLTLTRADRVIVADPSWNPSTDNQSVNRAHRIGQKKEVIVYRLMTCGTVQEKIYRRQVYKEGLFKTATEHKEQRRYFNPKDLKELFNLPEEGFDVSVTLRQMNEEHDHEHKVDDAFKAHIEFLKSLGIAGVSHHSLLFSKTEPVPENDEETRMCSCGEELLLLTSKTTQNPGRRFWSCPNWMKSDSCGFFEWY